MKPRTPIIALLLCLLGVGTIVWRGGHVSSRDRDQIERIISSDAKFKSVHVKQQLGNGLFLDGSVATTDDLNLLFQKVNEIKRGRVVSRVVVQSSHTAN
jgi:prepilin-type processing-associated H-X9-DG protein